LLLLLPELLLWLMLLLLYQHTCLSTVNIAGIKSKRANKQTDM